MTIGVSKIRLGRFGPNSILSKSFRPALVFWLKQIMHLQERTADSAVYLLSGQLPLVADLHKRVLGTLGCLLRSSSF